eukprot:TRINITY_DN1431_c0_g1_i4.p1 TRINITY_DN1431_c0_g1~~TRINITY_DN1431_c0_g1_i4.p1  ORF type:complete len:384 (-),score=113.57 TRINITY_DN1431_c0_g1_i4:168-1319(-)
MAKRKTEEMIKELKRRKTNEDEKLSDIAHDPRTVTWPTTSFPSGKARLYSWNVNGLKACMGRGDLQKFLKEEDPDLLCLNETKMDEKKIEAENVRKNLFQEKYLQYWNCCKSSSGYAGTAVLTKVKPLSVKFDLGIIEHDLEGRTITLEFADFILVACYVPNAGQKLDRLQYRTKQWDLDFRKYLKNMEQSKNKCVILCGDLNVAHEEIDIWNASGNKRSAGFTIEERTEFTNFLKLGFADSFRKLHPTTVKYSYWNLRSNARAENKGWRLDYFVVSEALMGAVTDSDMLTEVLGSDHCPLKLFLDMSKVKKPGIAQDWRAEEANTKSKDKGEDNGKEESEYEEDDDEKSEDEKKVRGKKETGKNAKQTRLKTKATAKKGGNP